MDINSVVQVNITRDTKVPTQKGFGVLAILSTEAAALGNLGVITEFLLETAPTEMVAAGFTTASLAYKAVMAMRSQNPRPEKVKIIKQAASVAQINTISVATLENNSDYVITLDGVEYKFTSDADATNAEIAAGLAALINPLDQVNAVVNVNTLVITAAVPGVGFSIVPDAKLTNVATTPSNGPVESIMAARDIDDDFYFIGTTSTVKADLEAIAAYTEGEIKLFAYQTSEANAKDQALNIDADSTLKMFKTKNRDRSFGSWVPADEAGEFKIYGWVARQATKIPGSTNWKFKNVKGVSPNKFNSTELKNLQDKNANIYVTIGGIDMFQEGVVASGEFIDIMIGTDFIQARIKEAVFGALTSNEKVPFDDGGIESIGLQVEKVLNNDGVKNQILVGDDTLDEDGKGMGPRVYVPLRKDTSKADRAARILKGITFTGNYSGAVNKVQINGTLTV